jgi:nicotinamidase-related amidase
METEDQFFKDRGFGLTLGFGKKPLLLVVDITNAFTDPGSPLGSDLGREIEQSNRLIDAAHAKRIPVIFSTVWYEQEDFSDAGIWVKKQAGVKHLRAGTRAVRLDERLHRAPGDAMLVKKYASCFFGTDLVTRLNSHGADTVLICGCSTSGCVRATAVDACQNGFRPMVVREAVGDRSQAAHEQSLFDLHSRYADVVGVEETLSYLKSLG